MQPVFCTRRGWIENATAAKDQRAMLAVCALPIPLLLQKTKAAKGRVFKIELSKVSSSALAAEICTDPHNRLLRRQHCSSLCSQSEGHEHVANMVNALGYNLVIFQLMLGRRNIRPPHFASKVSYSASPQTSAKCPRSGPCTAAPERGSVRRNPRRERPERAASPEPRATPWVSMHKRLRPVRAKVWAND